MTTRPNMDLPEVTKKFHLQFAWLAGTGRSGTSWLGKLMDAHDLVYYKHEPDNKKFFDLFGSIPSRIDIDQHEPAPVEAFRCAVEKTFSSYSPDIDILPHFKKSFLRNRCWQALTFAGRALRKLHVQKRPLLSVPDWFFVNANPVSGIIKSVTSNMKLAWVHDQFPSALIILLVRHPGGYLSSWIEGAIHHGWRGFGDRRRLDQTLLPFPENHHELFDLYMKGSNFDRELIYWILSNEIPISMLGRSERFMTVTYEDLCGQPHAVVENIFDFLGLKMTTSVSELVDATTTRHDPGYYSVYKHSSKVVEKWEEQLSAQQKAQIERVLSESFLSQLWAHG